MFVLHWSAVMKAQPTQDHERVQGQIERKEVDASPAAARTIAKRIEDEGGFWGPRKTN